MATVVGFVEQARTWIPDLVRRRRDREGTARFNDVRREPLQRGSVAELVRKLVIPRLGHGNTGQVSSATADAFAALALDTDPLPLRAQLDALLDGGMPVDSVFVDVLSPAARRLGEMWEADECDFVDVTMGLWRLQEIVRDLSARVPAKTNRAWRALFAPMPGEQHNFGTVIVEDVFRRDGWDSELLLGPTKSELLSTVADSHYDFVGLTVSLDANIGRLPSLLAAVRSVSRNARICIMLGGRVPAVDPEIVLRVGADCTAPDAREAVKVAARLVAANACREVFTA